jgi:hypothetical protein
MTELSRSRARGQLTDGLVAENPLQRDNERHGHLERHIPRLRKQPESRIRIACSPPNQQLTLLAQYLEVLPSSDEV